MNRPASNSGILLGGIVILVVVAVLVTYISEMLSHWFWIVLALVFLCSTGRTLNKR